MERIGLLVDENELVLIVDPHTETDLGEGCVPVGRQLGLLSVKPCHASWKIIGGLVAPEFGVIVKGFL